MKMPATKKIELIKDSGDKTKQRRSLIERIKSRQTEELVIAFCGPLGSGTSDVAEVVESILRSYGYETDYITVSDIIAGFVGGENFIKKLKEKPKSEKVKCLQDKGNEMRNKYGNDILAQHVINEIAVKRQMDKGNNSSNNEDDIKSRRFVTIVDSLKHPDEFVLLESVYGKMFYLFGVLCPEGIRIDRLQRQDRFSKKDAIILTERDREEGIKHGQQLLRTILHSDFFVRNSKNNKKLLETPVTKYIELILGKKIFTPTVHEYAMHAAHSAALRSACMSRQVGAAIVNNYGEIITTGCNDVPKFGGGLYAYGESEDDSRCIMSLNGKCHSHEHKERIFEDIKKIIRSTIKNIEGDGWDGTIDELYREISKISRLKGLIEFSRAVHAEMDAITSAARNPNISLKGSTLYCTTFPCHNCARHIVASGIEKVYYIEPYEKSLAYDLHYDSIEIEVSDEDEEMKRVKIMPFEGVAPKQYMKLFAATERKKNGQRLDVDLNKAKPIVAKFLDTHVDYERTVVAYLKKCAEGEKLS